MGQRERKSHQGCWRVQLINYAWLQPCAHECLFEYSSKRDCSAGCCQIVSDLQRHLVYSNINAKQGAFIQQLLSFLLTFPFFLSASNSDVQRAKSPKQSGLCLWFSNWLRALWLREDSQTLRVSPKVWALFFKPPMVASVLTFCECLKATNYIFESPLTVSVSE